MENTKPQFTDDQKAVVARDIKKAYGAMSSLLEWVDDDSLCEDMRESLPKLIDSYMKNVKDAIGFTGKESERDKEITESIGQHYQKQIKNLEDALENQHSIASIAANVEIAFKKIEKWWDVEGFNYIHEKTVVSGGKIQVNLGFMLNTFTSMYSDTPVSDRKQAKTKLQYLKDQGFMFTPKVRGNGVDLIDNEYNRGLLEGLITDAFPSAKIWSHQNRRLSHKDDDTFILKYLEFIICDLKDVEQLTIEEKQFLPEDE